MHRNNAKSPKRDKEQDSPGEWQDWLPIRAPQQSSQSPTDSIHQTQRSDTLARAWRDSSAEQPVDAPPLRPAGFLSALPRHTHSPSNELFIRHVTRDSMVDNLLNSFDLLPEGSVTYPAQGPFVSGFPTTAPVSLDQPIVAQASRPVSHSRDTSSPGTTFFADDDSLSVHQEPFDPYSIRTTPIRTKPNSPRVATFVPTHAPGMESKGHARSSSTSRPGSSRHSKKKSKSSNKSIELKESATPQSPSSRPGPRSGNVDGQVSKEVKATRRRSRTGPSVTATSSILDRARPVPAEYHDFNRPSHVTHTASEWKSSFSSSNRPTIFYRSSDGLSNDENFKPQISSRGKVAALTGSDMVLASSRASMTSPANSSRQVSVGMLDSVATTAKSTAPDMVRPQPSVEPARGKQGFFRRVFRASKTNTPRPETSDFQEPPLTTTGHGLDSSTPRPPLSLTEDSHSSSVSISKASSPTFSSEPPQPPRELVARDGQHVVQKKSSFFRRRKRSVTGNLATDPLPSHGSGQADSPARENRASSSSLRQAMDSFLLETSQDTVGSPETFFFDSREQQSRDGQPDSETNGFSNSSRRLSQISAQLGEEYSKSRAGSATPWQDPIQASPSLAPAARTKTESTSSSTGRSFAPPVGFGIYTDTSDSRVALSPNKHRNSRHSDATIRQFAASAPLLDKAGTVTPLSSKRSAASAAQLTGRVMPGDSVEDDWVSNTPFRRPKALESTSKPPRLWLSAVDGEDATIGAARPTMQGSRSMSSVPTVQLGDEDEVEARSLRSPEVSEFDGMALGADDQELARKMFEEHNSAVVQAQAALVLGQQYKEALRHAYLGMFDFSGINILLAFRDLCGRLALKGETQQVDRIMTAFSERWWECNPNNGFKSRDVVHTICYSILLLNTDLHIADVDQKMTRPQFLKNTLGTVTSVADGEPLLAASNLGVQVSTSGRSTPWRDTRSPSPIDTRPSTDGNRLNVRNSSLRPTSGVGFLNSPGPFDSRPMDPADLLVSTTFDGPIKAWEDRVATVLKEFYASIRNQRLPLHGASEPHLQDSNSSSNNNLTVNSTGLLRRAGSIASKTGSEGPRRGPDMRSAANSWNVRNKSKAKLYHGSTFGSSTTSFEEGGSVFSPTASSTWSRSLGKPTTAMSSDSLASAFTNADYGIPASVGFASALSQAIIREEEGPYNEDDSGIVPLLDDETLELEGAPWAKEGMLHHKHHLEATDKKAKDRNWNQCFAVVEKGQLRLFSFSSKIAGRSQRNKTLKGGIVGGGNWMDNAEELATFTLRQTLANELPPPGYSTKRPHVFALMFPTGALHLFHVGTPDIAREFVSTANYWSARLSKEPLVGGVSNIEYGWSENIISSALLAHGEVGGGGRPMSSAQVHSPAPSTSGLSSRPSFQGSMRGPSFDLPGRPTRMPADKIPLNEWVPPQQSLGRSDLREGQQLAALKRYVKDVEDDLRLHNELRGALTLVYTPRHHNANKAMHNWEQKSSYLLREIVKFRTYIDSLEAAQVAKERIYLERAERLRPDSSAV